MTAVKGLLLPFSTFCLAIFLSGTVCAQVSGTVFRDFNANGAKDNSTTFNEPFLGGIIVKAYDAAGMEVGSVTTASNGTYSFTGLTLPLRIEFSGYATGDYSGPVGTSNTSSVQFYSAATTTANFGINYPGDYCQATPFMATPCYVSGDPLGGGTSGTEDVLVSFSYANSGIGTNAGFAPFGISATAPLPTHGAFGSEIGATWGIAYQRTQKRLFTAAFIKRHTGIGPLGEGGIYVLDYSSGTAVVSNFVDVNTIGINTGTVGTGATPALRNVSRGLLPGKTAVTTAVADVVAFDAVGKKGIGDLDISDDETTLWLINLNDQTLNSIVIDSDNNPATAPTSADVQTFALPSNPCSAGTLRPFAIEYYKGTVYVGAVCDASLQAFIYSFNGTSFSPVLVNGAAAISLVYDKGQATSSSTCSGAANDGWFIWRSTPPLACSGEGTANKLYAYPTPMLCDIEFDVDGSMILSFNDRSGHQLGAKNTQYDGSGEENIHTAGDLLRVCNTASGFALQGTAGCPNNSANSQGPGGGEFYYQDYINYGGLLHSETTVGGLALQSGKGEVALTCFDPFNTVFLTGGVNWFNNTTGLSRAQGYVIYFGENGAGSFGGEGNFSKAAGLGDLELLCNPEPIEIGNRVWLDPDGDGIQDPNESGIGNVTLELFADFNNDGIPDGAALASTTTAATGDIGSWYFNASNVTDGDPTVAGNQAGPQPNKRYLVRVAASDWTAAGLSTGDLTGLTLTGGTNEALGIQPDVRDNDAALLSNIPTISYQLGTAGQNNHTLDMGFVACPTITNPNGPLTVCSGTPVSTLSASTTETGTDAIRFAYFTADVMSGSTPTDAEAAIIYNYSANGGTDLGLATPSGGTVSLSNVSFPVNNTTAPITYYVYVILNPDPGISCRPATEIQVTVYPEATATAGGPDNVCQSATPGPITLSGATIGGGATTGAWSIISGGGTLSSTSPTATPGTVTYTPAANFTGTVTLRLTTDAPAGVCPAVTVDRIITVDPLPVITSTNSSVCAGNTINLVPLVIGNTPAGTLTFHATLADAEAGINDLVNTTVAPAATTTYYVRSEILSTGCFSTAPIVVTVNPIPNPTVSNGSVCVGGSINLASLVTLDATGGTMTFYTTYNNAVAGINSIASVVTLAETTNYYVRTTSTSGCYAVKEIVVRTTAPACGTIQVVGPGN